MAAKAGSSKVPEGESGAAKLKKVTPKTTGKPAPKFARKSGATVACPSCRAQVRLDARGAPISHDVAHFTSAGKAEEKPALEETPATPATVETPAAPESGWSRFDRNLNQMLED